MVRRVAGGATDVVLAVYRVDGIHVLRATRVAGQAPRVDFLRGSALEQEYLGFVAAPRHMVRTRTMAAFAPLFRRTAFRIESRLPVRSLLPGVVDILVASLAGFGAEVLGSPGRRHAGRRYTGRRHTGGFSILRRNWWGGLP